MFALFEDFYQEELNFYCLQHMYYCLVDYQACGFRISLFFACLQGILKRVLNDLTFCFIPYRLSSYLVFC